MLFGDDESVLVELWTLSSRPSGVASLTCQLLWHDHSAAQLSYRWGLFWTNYMGHMQNSS